jgi:hypothetical protein
MAVGECEDGRMSEWVREWVNGEVVGRLGEWLIEHRG